MACVCGVFWPFFDSTVFPDDDDDETDDRFDASPAPFRDAFRSCRTSPPVSLVSAKSLEPRVAWSWVCPRRDFSTRAHRAIPDETLLQHALPRSPLPSPEAQRDAPPVRRVFVLGRVRSRATPPHAGDARCADAAAATPNAHDMTHVRRFGRCRRETSEMYTSVSSLHASVHVRAYAPRGNPRAVRERWPSSPEPAFAVVRAIGNDAAAVPVETRPWSRRTDVEQYVSRGQI